MTQSRFSSLVATVGVCVGVAVLSMASPASANDGVFTVPLSKNELVRLPAPASAIIVGDPAVADISVHSSDTLLVIGRSFGETNLIVLDEAGQTMMNADIQVVDTRGKGHVRLYKIGEGRESYRCNPHCLPAPALGDQLNFFNAFTSKKRAITNQVAGGPSTLSAATFSGPSLSGAPGNGQSFTNGPR